MMAGMNEVTQSPGAYHRGTVWIAQILEELIWQSLGISGMKKGRGARASRFWM